ncbi:MAG: sigma-70 family RNA polymerase sigma factor, partial [Actinobacteria bacterium]|nr:sigma-70 family RNA polymerase sigma factor [Actinomycetota bacterium]
ITPEGILEIIRGYARPELTTFDNLDGTIDAPIPFSGRVIRSLRHQSFVLPIEDRIALYEALAHLSETQRRLIYLLFFRDLTQQQVADELGMSQRSVSREKHRALSQLKAFLTRKIF